MSHSLKSFDFFRRLCNTSKCDQERGALRSFPNINLSFDMQKLQQDAALSCRCTVFLAMRAERQAIAEQTSVSTIMRKALAAYLARVDALA